MCDCVVKDSINFLDHINGTKRKLTDNYFQRSFINGSFFFYLLDQRNLGMSMKIERSSLDQVKARFASNKKKLDEKKKDYDLEQRVKELKEEVCFSCIKEYLFCIYISEKPNHTIYIELRKKKLRNIEKKRRKIKKEN